MYVREKRFTELTHLGYCAARATTVTETHLYDELISVFQVQVNTSWGRVCIAASCILLLHHHHRSYWLHDESWTLYMCNIAV